MGRQAESRSSGLFPAVLPAAEIGFSPIHILYCPGHLIFLHTTGIAPFFQPGELAVLLPPDLTTHASCRQTMAEVRRRLESRGRVFYLRHSFRFRTELYIAAPPVSRDMTGAGSQTEPLPPEDMVWHPEISGAPEFAMHLKSGIPSGIGQL